MKNQRLRVPVDDPYLMAIGRAIYIYARLEWIAVWCCEVLQENYIAKLGKKPASAIAKDLARLIGQHPDAEIREQFLDHVQEFKRLSEVRNGLVHGKPGTVSKTGEQRLFHKGIPWTIEMVDDITDQFADCSIKLNERYYHYLK